MYRCLSKARLVPNETITVEALLSSTQCLFKCHPIPMRHHIVQNWVYCTVQQQQEHEQPQ